MFQHQGETTNNHSEGYNFRLGNKKNIGKHPNFYQWAEKIKLELEISHDEALAAEAGKPNTRYRHSKDKRNMGMRKKLMLDVQDDAQDLIKDQAIARGSFPGE